MVPCTFVCTASKQPVSCVVLAQAADEVVQLHKSVKMKMFLPGQRLHIPYPHQRGTNWFESVPRWAQRGGKGAVSFARLTRQLPSPQPSQPAK